MPRLSRSTPTPARPPRRNRGADWKIIEGDVASLDGRGLAGVDLFAGGVPCPPFSIAGRQVPDDRDVRRLRWLDAQLGDRLLDCAVITAGPAAYRRPDGIAVIPAALLGP